MGIQLKGLEQALKNIQKQADRSAGFSDGIVRKLAEKIYADAIELTPIDTGQLRETSTLLPLPGGGYEIRFVAPYAVYVHEILENRHAFPTTAKFLHFAILKNINERALANFSQYPRKNQ